MEWIYNLKRNGLLTILKTSILLLILLLLYFFITFSQKIDTKLSGIQNEGSDHQLFSVTDTLTDGDDFYNFRKSIDKLNSIKTFYDSLNSHNDFKFLSAFDQHFVIENFKGDLKFNPYYGSDMTDEVGLNESYLDPETKKTVSDVKSFQMNRQFFDFYHLEIEEGHQFSWDEVDYEKTTIPVILGSNYKGIYKLGDRMNGYYYFMPYEFKIAGFLKENSAVFYQNNINHYLDDSLIVPYPDKIPSVTKGNQEFLGILLFAMLGGDIAVKKEIDFANINQQLARLAKESGFNDYTLLGYPIFVLQYQRMFELINSNKKILVISFVSLVLLTTAILIFLTYKMYQRRRKKYYLTYLLGEEESVIKRLLFFDLLPGNLLGIILFSQLFYILPIRSIGTFISLLIGGVVFMFSDYLIMVTHLNKDIKKCFNDFY